MKKYPSKLIGKKVYIKDNIDSMWAGHIGIIKLYDGDVYHIKIVDTQPIFSRNEFIVPKNQWYPRSLKELENYQKYGIKELEKGK